MKSFTPMIDALLTEDRLPGLGPGTPMKALRRKLAALTPEAILAPHAVRDADMAQCCLAGLWLHFDFLDESHAISQNIATPSGSCWHGIMHRREGDFSNAKYWFRRVGAHPIFVSLQASAEQLAVQLTDLPSTSFLKQQSTWDPFAFIDLCERAMGQGPPLDMLCLQVQQEEWVALFDYCLRNAVAD